MRAPLSNAAMRGLMETPNPLTTHAVTEAMVSTSAKGAFLTRGLENVRGEFSLTALAYDIRRAMALVGYRADGT